ncbi:DUF4175 domain-containing protein, partial [candidate division WOR-3 bacterium]|nr:DUF4175 domain-containing protein [candidate division WOR-3 bacterium]
MSPAYERLKGRIGRLQRQCAVNDVAAAGLAAAGLAGLGLAVVAALFWSGWVLAALVVPMVWLAVRWRRDFAVAGVARQAEDQLAEVRGRLTVALELGRYEPESRERYSAELLDAAVAQVEAQVAGLPLAGVVRRSRLAWAGLVCVAGAAALAGLWLAGPVRAGIGLVNAFRPGAVPVAFRVEPGDTAVLPGGVVVVRCRVEPAGVFTWVRLELRGQAREPRRLRLDGDTCRVPLNVHEDLRYRFRVLGRWSVEHRVRLLEPLVAERLAFTYRYPPHTGLAESRSPGTDLSAPRGTRVLFEGRANHALSSGRLVLGADTVVAAIDLEDSARFSGEFGLVADCDGRVELSEGGAFQAVAGLHVHAVADEPPFVKLFMPGRDVDLPQEMQVLLGVNSIDDYGLGSLYLCSGRESLDQRLRLKGLDGRREDTTLYVWDLSGSGLLPGEELRYWVEVSDNDAVSGPKTSRSEVFSVRFPTMAELFDAAVNQTERTASQLGALPAHQSALSSELARVSDELKRSRELPWEERRRLEQILQEQERLAGRVDHLSREVSETAQELMQGITLDPETMQELGQLQSLLAQLLPPELQQALQHLRERLQQDSPQLGPAMEQMQIAQEKLQEGIDRALELLKRIMQEQRLEALACKAEELAEAQERLTAEMRQQPGEQLAQKQEDIRQGLDSLQWVMEELAREFRESDSGPGSEADVGDSLAALNEQLEQDQASERAEQLAQQMSSGQVQSAQQRQSRELSGQFRQVAQSLAQLSQELKERRSAQVGQKLAASAADLLMLSEQQERLEQAAGSMADPAGSAGQQQALQEGTRIAAESLAALAGRTMVTSPELGQALALAMQSMQDAA